MRFLNEFELFLKNDGHICLTFEIYAQLSQFMLNSRHIWHKCSTSGTSGKYAQHPEHMPNFSQNRETTIIAHQYKFIKRR
jgi:hypothetical protein